MQVVNRKERSNAKWRFAGLYLLSLAVPALIILNTVNMKAVNENDNKQLLEQLRKRDLALAELSKLAATLHEAQKLKPAYIRDAVDQERYDKLRYDFMNGVDAMKRLYYSDTALYRANYSLLSYLEFNQREHQNLSDEFNKKVEDEVLRQSAARVASGKGGGGGGSNEAELLMVKRDLRQAERTIADLERQLAAPRSDNSESIQLIEIKNKARAIERNIDQIVTVLSTIEQESNGIERKNDKNLAIKKSIQDKVRFLKNHVDGIKNTNNNLIGSIKTPDNPSEHN